MDKESAIQTKNSMIAKMEAEHEQKMEDLRTEFEHEKKKKQDLDKQLKDAQNELNDIENSFPKEVSDLKEKIEFAKQETLRYEKKTDELQKELL